MKQVLIRRGTPIVADVPAPQLSDNTILVEVRYSLISTGTEVAGIVSSNTSLLWQAVRDPKKVIRGLQMLKETGFRRTMAVVDGELETASPTGYSCSGIVLGCGKNITHFAVGDRVACAGAGQANHAQIVAVPQNLAVRVPEGCDLESAASATIGAIAMQGVRRADVRLGESVVVIGLGLIGQITAQLLKAAGCRVIGTDIDAGRISTAKTLGIWAALGPDDGDPAGQVLHLTGGAGADTVIIAASAQSGSILQQSMQMVRRKGRVVVVGAVPLQMDRSPFYEKEADLVMSCSYGPGRYDPEYEARGLDYPYAYVRWTENRNMAEYLRLVSEGQVNLQGLISGKWMLSEAPQAYQDLRDKKAIAALLSYPEGEAGEKLTSRVYMPLVPQPAAGARIRVGVVGPGSFARAVHLPNLQQLKENFSITAVASRSGPSAWNVAAQYGAKYASTEPGDLFKDPDIDLLLIACRHNLHASLAIEAARHGKSVLLEKPAALNQSELDQLLGAVRSSNSLLMVGYNRRFSPFVTEMKRLVDERSGPVVITYRINAGYIAPDSWVQGPEGGGRIIGECCHIFDLFNYIIGHFPEAISATPLRPSAPHVLATDNFTATLRYSDGSLCTLTYTSLGSSETPKEAMELFFDGKTFVLDDYKRLSFNGTGKKPKATLQQDKGHLEELRVLARYIQSGGPPPMTLEEIEAASRASFIVDNLVRTAACAES